MFLPLLSLYVKNIKVILNINITRKKLFSKLFCLDVDFSVVKLKLKLNFRSMKKVMVRCWSGRGIDN